MRIQSRWVLSVHKSRLNSSTHPAFKILINGVSGCKIWPGISRRKIMKQRKGQQIATDRRAQPRGEIIRPGSYAIMQNVGNNHKRPYTPGVDAPNCDREPEPREFDMNVWQRKARLTNRLEAGKSLVGQEYGSERALHKDWLHSHLFVVFKHVLVRWRPIILLWSRDMSRI